MDSAIASDSREIERFLARAYECIDTQAKLGRVGNDEGDIAAFARAHGFRFSGEQLVAYIAAQLESRLTADQVRARTRALQAASAPHAPAGPCAPRISKCAAASAPLARERLFAGDIFMVAGAAASEGLAAYLRGHLEGTFGASPQEALAHLDESACHARIREIDSSLAGDTRIPGLVAGLVRSLGWPCAGLRYFGPFVRYNLPPRSGIGGFFSQVPVRFTSRHGGGARPELLNGHRDTWFGAPFHQLNLWAPLYPYPRGSGIVMMPSLFGRGLANNTAGFDVWRAALGYAVGPMCLEALEGVEAVELALEVGDLAVFSANHFHGTGANPGPASRISFELRVVLDEDRRNGRAAPNVDFHGAGELDQFRMLPG